LGSHVNVLRGDEVHQSLTPDDATSNAPDKDGPFFRVPKVVE
jgi:aspartyl/glutamyl-tRNA(Asn/Gln) amidotransferase C subunit